MIKKIKQLTIIFIKDYLEKINIKKDKNKNSFFWILPVFIFCLIYLSYNIMDYLQKINEPLLFVKIYLPIFAIITIFQLIIVTVGILFYSKDLEYLIPLPIKPYELLISKLVTIIVIMYISEALFLVIPLFIYGIFIIGTINYFITGIIILLIFPILYVLIIALICSIMMNFSKIIKNQNILQMLIILFLTIMLIFFGFKIFNNVFLEEYSESLSKVEKLNIKLEKANEYFVQINPIIQILISKNYFYIFWNILKIILLDLILFVIFMFVNQKTYYKNILHGLNKIKTKKEIKYKKNKYKKNKKEKIYFKNEIKKILKDITFFNQGVYQYICVVAVLLFIINLFIPLIIESFQQNNTIEEIGIEQFKLQVTCLLLAVVQFCFIFNNLSITVISRDRQEAMFMKYIPMPLYKQFIIKSIPHIILNVFTIIVTIIVIYINVEQISIYYYIMFFILSMLINILDSEIMLLIDCKKPDLNWINKEVVMKDNKKKIYKIVYTILIMIILKYFTKIFEHIKYQISIIFILIIFILLVIFLNIYIKKNINKIFKNIY